MRAERSSSGSCAKRGRPYEGSVGEPWRGQKPVTGPSDRHPVVITGYRRTPTARCRSAGGTALPTRAEGGAHVVETPSPSEPTGDARRTRLAARPSPHARRDAHRGRTRRRGGGRAASQRPVHGQQPVASGRRGEAVAGPCEEARGRTHAAPAEAARREAGAALPRPSEAGGGRGTGAAADPAGHHRAADAEGHGVPEDGAVLGRRGASEDLLHTREREHQRSLRHQSRGRAHLHHPDGEHHGPDLRQGRQRRGLPVRPGNVLRLPGR